MEIFPTEFAELYLVRLKKNFDDRGYFTRIMCKKILDSHGIKFDVVQINHAFSKVQGTFRGLHIQLDDAAETKFITVVSGKVQDFALDLRKDSNTYLQVFSKNLGNEDYQGIIIPRGFAHGYLTLSENVNMNYAVNNLYNSTKEISINPFQPQILNLLEGEIKLISKKDKEGLSIKESINKI